MVVDLSDGMTFFEFEISCYLQWVCSGVNLDCTRTKVFATPSSSVIAYNC